MEKEKVEISNIIPLPLQWLQLLSLSLRILLTGKPESCWVTDKTMQVVHPEQGFPEIFIIIQTWKNDGNIVDVKVTLSRRYKCEQKVFVTWRRAACRWRLFDGYLRQTGAASSHHAHTWVQLCVYVCARDLSTCNALLFSLPLFPQILIIFPLHYTLSFPLCS